jgi:hypothetical protein
MNEKNPEEQGSSPELSKDTKVISDPYPEEVKTNPIFDQPKRSKLDEEEKKGVKFLESKPSKDDLEAHFDLKQLDEYEPLISGVMPLDSMEAQVSDQKHLLTTLLVTCYFDE